MTCSEYSLQFLRPLFVLFPCIYQFINFSFHCLCHSPCFTFSAPSVYGCRSFLALHVLPFKHLIKLSLGPHHMLELTAALLLSVTFPYLLGLRKREPIFVALPFVFPFVSFFSSVASLHRIISDSEDLFPFLTVAGLLLLYLCLLTIFSFFFLLFSYFFHP